MHPESIDTSQGPAGHGLRDDVCRHCGRSSARTHPGGVIAGGNWLCGERDCRRWQSGDGMTSKGVVGDLVVAIIGGRQDPAVDWRIVAIEQISDGADAKEIRDRWMAQGVIDGLGRAELWECGPGGHYKRRGVLR